MFAYPRIAEKLFGRAHAIEPAALRTIMEGPLLRRILAGEAVEDHEAIAKTRAARRARLSAAVDAETVNVGDIGEYALTGQGIAVVPISGVLAQRFDFMAALCGWTTYEGLIAVCDAMANDYRVNGVLLDVESPGGEVSGMLDAADAIIQLNQLKPVWAVANSYAYSAAYALAGSAERLIVPRMADVGSIGAVAVHVDESAADEADGLKYTAVYSGARKIDGWGHAPLSEDARAIMQERVDYARQGFAELVGRQGRMSTEAALATEAATYTDQAAVDAGLADAVGNFEQALAELTTEVAGFAGDVGARVRAINTKMENTKMPMAKTAAQVAADKEMQDRVDAAVKEQLDAAVTAAKAEGKTEGIAEAKAAADALEAAKPKEPAVDPDAYTADMASQVTEMCALAGVSATKLKKFIDAKTAPEKVKAALLKDVADRAESDAVINPTAKDAPGAKDQAAITEMWATSIAKANKALGGKPRQK